MSLEGDGIELIRRPLFQCDVIRRFLPVDDLLVRLVGVLRAERWIAHETFEHDRTE